MAKKKINIKNLSPSKKKPTDKEIEAMANQASKKPNKAAVKKNEKSVPFNMRMPSHLAERLTDASSTSGLSRAAIIIRALNAELKKMKEEM